MANTKGKGIITFSYDLASLFNDVCLLSAYMTKNLATESGSLMDEFCITEDEKEIFDECLKQVLPDIYETLIGVVPCIADSVGIKTETPKTETKSIEVSVRDNHAYNVNVLTIIDSTLNNCIKYGVLAAFYSICTHAVLHDIAKAKFEENVFQLKQRLNPMYRRTVSSQF